MSLVRRAAVALVWLIALSRAAHAGEAADPIGATDDLPQGQARYRWFGPDDGLRNLVISSIVQDRDGFLWLGTDDGVYRFDGTRFTHFTVDDGLPSSLITTLGNRPDGAVCVGTHNGIVCWDGTRFARLGGLPSNTTVYTMASFAGRLWIGTEGAGLRVEDDRGVLVPAPGWPGSPTGSIRALWADARGLVVGEGAAVQLGSGNGVWRALGDIGLGSARVDGVLRDRDGALWIRTPSSLSVLAPGATTARDVSAGLPPSYSVVGIPTGMAIGPRGDVLVATDAGIAARSRDRWRTISLAHAGSAPAAPVRTLFIDREGTIWIGSAGLLQLRGRGVIEHYDAINGPPGDVVWTYQRDRQGALWVGTNRCLARAVAGRWDCLPGTEGRMVRSAVFPPQGGVFIGGAPSDLLYLAPDGRATSLVAADGDQFILALALGPDGALWVGTRGGLYRLPGAVPGPLERIQIPGTGPAGRFSSFAVVGSQLWTATAGGVAVLEHGAWQLFDHRAGFRAAPMRYVLARADGRLCAAYSEPIGLTCFRYDGHAVTNLEHLGPADGLVSGMIYFLGEDHQRRLWIGTGAGLNVVTPRGIDHFDESDGLAGNDSSATAFLADPDGSLWLGATGGATHLFAQHYGGPPRAPRTAFLSGRLGSRPLATGQSIVVAHDRNSLAVEFAASSLLDARRNDYQIRLSPLETEWSTTHQREARYPGLRPGTYRFEVRARIETGSWGPATALAFTVQPAWWQTGWFFAVIGLSIALAIGLGVAWWMRRRTRELHERANASFRAVIDLMPDMIAAQRRNKLIYINAASLRFLGLALGDRWDDAAIVERVHPDDRRLVVELFRRIRRAAPQHVAEIAEIRIRGADGSFRTCEVSGGLVEVGGALTLVASGRDVTDRRQMRAKLLVNDRMASLGTLAAGIAHEINNPLACVTGNLEVAAETLKALASAPGVSAGHIDASDAINDARAGAERVRKIVQGLRLFSRSEEEQRVPLALADVLDAAIRLSGNEVRHRTQLVCELGPVPLVVADHGRLTQAFINLLINAAHAIPEGRSDANRITVRTRTDEQGRAVVEIEDTGKGMPPDVQSRVFDPFFTTKDVGGGSGLGLSICHGIITALGGQITIDSALGRGTLVRVILPPAGRPPAEPAAAASVAGRRPAGQPRQRVMLVDDEPKVAETMERLLRRDYDITIAACGAEALAHIAQGVRFDAIVSDVMMPNMTGIELVDELRRIAPDQAERLIFLSGGAFTAQTRERLDQLGVPQLEKPVTAKELRASVMRIANEVRSPPL